MKRGVCSLLVFVAGCSGGIQSAVSPASVEARHLDSLFWSFFGVLSVTYVLVVLATALAAWRGARRRRSEPDAPPSPHDDATTHRRLARRIGIAAGLSAIVLFTLLVQSEVVGHAVDDVPVGSDTLQVDVIGHQWWWQIQYRSEQPSQRLTTANELYLPVGRPVVLHLSSRDVIHSLWVPNIHGKMDLIPGYERKLVVRIDRPGVYRGQCAEFCGAQHAHMGLRVFAVEPERFERWREAQLRPAREPATDVQRRGRDVFVQSSCVLCHTIRGTPAAATFGPDLTHLASRSTIAAGSRSNTRGNLAGWILDPQSIKPGAKMPPNRLGGEDLQALLAYLGSLR